MTNSLLLRSLSLLALSISTLCSVGCTATPVLKPGSLFGSDEPVQPPPVDPNAPSITVMLKTPGGKSKSATLPFKEGAFVSHALEATRAHKRFSRQRITLVRKTPPRGRTLRMAVEFKNKRVAPSTDYALHPGDVIEVTQDKSTMFDDVLGEAFGPLGKTVAKHAMLGPGGE